jgi:hypothetical protein
MNLFRKYSLLLFLLILTNWASAQFAPKDQAEIRKKAQRLLIDYQDKINQIGKEVHSIDKTRLNIEAFNKLFVDRKTQVYNDLDPAHILSEYYEIETYSSNIALWYPNGIVIALDFDNAQVSNIISHGEGVYSIDFIVDKKINGLYLGKKLNTNVENILFRIGFTGIGQQYQNFKIAGVRKPTKKSIEQTDSKILEVRSTPLSFDERRDIDRETRTLLNDYTNYLSLIGDTVENIEEKLIYKESFKSLFTNTQSPVFNDILPEGMRNQFVPVSDYINLYSEAYSSEGGKVTFDTDSADLGFITKRNDSVFTRNVQVNKYFEGNYLGKQKVKFKNRLKLVVIFVYRNGVYKDFKISKIDKVLEVKAEVAETRTYTDFRKRGKKTAEVKAPESVLPVEDDKTKVQFHFGGAVGFGLIYDQNLGSLTMEDNAHEWKIEPQLYYSGFLHYTYKISPRIGLQTGLCYTKLGTKYKLNSFRGGADSLFYDKSVDFTDKNDSLKFYAVISANIDSLVELNTINIPIGLILYFNRTGKVKFFLKPGINICIINSATTTYNSYINFGGFYEAEKFDVFKYKNWPEFDFYTKQSSANKKDIKSAFNTITYNAYTNFGISISLSKRMELSVSGEVQYGLTNLVKNTGVYKDIFGQTGLTSVPFSKKHVFESKPVNIITYGADFEFVVKF